MMTRYLPRVATLLAFTALTASMHLVDPGGDGLSGLEGNPEEDDLRNTSDEADGTKNARLKECYTQWNLSSVTDRIRRIRAACPRKCQKGGGLSNRNAIPRIMHYTQCCEKRSAWKFNHRKHEAEWNNTFRASWDMRFWDDHSLLRFMREVVPGIEEIAWFEDVWGRLPYKIQQIDAARYCWLYVYGGMYSDLDVAFQKDPAALIEDSDELVLLDFSDELCAGCGRCGPHLDNWLMASVPRHPLWVHVLTHISQQVEHQQSEGRFDEVLLTTGPFALGSALASWDRAERDCAEGKLHLLPHSCGFHSDGTYSWSRYEPSGAA